MKQNRWSLPIIIAISFVLSSNAFSQQLATPDNIISYIADPTKQDVNLYWKDDSGHILGSIQRLKEYLAGKNSKLVFAMNGGMFTQDYLPVGLFIQAQKTIRRLNTSSGDGN